VILGVVKESPTHYDRVRHRKDGGWCDESGLQGGGKGDDLKDRARLVGLGEGQVVDRLIDPRVTTVLSPGRNGTQDARAGLGVDEGRVRQNLAGLHVYDDGETSQP